MVPEHHIHYFHGEIVVVDSIIINLSYLVLEWRLCLVEFGSTIPKLDAEFVRFGSNTTGRCVASGFAAATICHLRVLGLTQDEV